MRQVFGIVGGVVCGLFVTVLFVMLLRLPIELVFVLTIVGLGFGVCAVVAGHAALSEAATLAADRATRWNQEHAVRVAAEEASTAALAGMNKANGLYHDAATALAKAETKLGEYDRVHRDDDVQIRALTGALARARAMPEVDGRRVTLRLLPGTVVTVRGPDEPVFTFSSPEEEPTDAADAEATTADEA